MKPTLIKAIDPADLIFQVHKMLESKQDMHTPLFVDDHGMLCQFVVPSLCVYEYQLVIANDLDDFELQVQNLSEMDYDFMFNTVMWRGKYLQWMSRLNPTGLKVRDAVAVVHAERADELKLVEDVRAVTNFAPFSLEGYVVTIPFPLRLS